MLYKLERIIDFLIIVNRHCFVENMYRNRIMEPTMYQILQEWYQFIDKIVHIQADLIG